MFETRVFLKELIEQVDFEKKQQKSSRQQKSMPNFPACKEIKLHEQLLHV